MKIKMMALLIILSIIGGTQYYFMNNSSQEIYLSSNENQIISIFGDTIKTKLENQENVKIVCLGDSVTAGTSLVTVDGYDDYIITEENYPAVLEELLKEYYGYEEISVVNYGVPGATSDDLMNYYSALETENADLVIMMYGINDYGQGGTTDNYYANLVEAANYFKSLGISMAILSPTPTLYQEESTTSVAFQEFVESAALAASDTNSYYIDMNLNIETYLDGESVYTIMYDGIHFNQEEYSIVSNYIFEAINSL